MWRQRVIFGTLLIAVLLGLIVADAHLSGRRATTQNNVGLLQTLFLSGGLTSLVILAAAVAGAYEACELARAAGHQPMHRLVMLGVLVLAAIPWLTHADPGASPEQAARSDWQWTCLVIVAGVLLSAVAVMAGPGVRDGIANTAVSCFLMLYVGLLAGFAVRLRQDLAGPMGAWALLYLILVTKSADIGGYACGSLFGRHRIVPGISPNKTLEGFIGGVVLAVGVAWLGNELFLRIAAGIDGLRAVHVVLFGAIVGVVSPVGDLFESLIKRDADRKDSGSHIPTFGGILDLIDSPLFSVPVGWFLLTNWLGTG